MLTLFLATLWYFSVDLQWSRGAEWYVTGLIADMMWLAGVQMGALLWRR